MKVRNITSDHRSIVDPDGGDDIECPAGEVVEVDAELGARLLEQVDVWRRPQAKAKANAPATKRTAPTAPAPGDTTIDDEAGAAGEEA